MLTVQWSSNSFLKSPSFRRSFLYFYIVPRVADITRSEVGCSPRAAGCASLSYISASFWLDSDDLAELGRVKKIGYSEPNAMLVRHRGGGALEISPDGADGALGWSWCRTSAVDGCLCRKQRAAGDLDGWPLAASLSVGLSWMTRTALEQTPRVLGNWMPQFMIIFRHSPASFLRVLRIQPSRRMKRRAGWSPPLPPQHTSFSRRSPLPRRFWVLMSSGQSPPCPVYCGVLRPPTLTRRVGLRCPCSWWLNSEDSKKEYQQRKLRTAWTASLRPISLTLPSACMGHLNLVRRIVP